VVFSSHCCFDKFFCSLLLGGAVAPASHRVCLQLTWEVSLPPSPVEFSSLCHSWLLGACPRSHQSLSSQAQLVYLQFWEGLPSPIFGAQCTPPSFPCVFIVLIAYYSVSLFSWGGGRSVQGAMLIWPRAVCGSTTVLLSSNCPHLPKPSGRGQLEAWGPSWFPRLTRSGDSLLWLDVWRGQSFASSQWFNLQGVSLASLQDFTIGGMLSASSL
jgi:hypothetical protein